MTNRVAITAPAADSTTSLMPAAPNCGSPTIPSKAPRARWASAWALSSLRTEPSGGHGDRPGTGRLRVVAGCRAKPVVAHDLRPTGHPTGARADPRAGRAVAGPGSGYRRPAGR